MPYYPPLIMKPPYLLVVSSLAILRHPMHTQPVSEVSTTTVSEDRDLGDRCLEASAQYRLEQLSAFPMVRSRHTQLLHTIQPPLCALISASYVSGVIASNGFFRRCGLLGLSPETHF
jgi:hypothetical protein